MALDISIMKDPYGEWVPEFGDHNTKEELHIDEWAELFFDVLKCPDREKYRFDEDFTMFEERQRELFQSAIPEFPMLSRISEWYIDIRYLAAEVEELLAECKTIKQRTRKKLALDMLDKLIETSEDAIRHKSGLFLAAD